MHGNVGRASNHAKPKSLQRRVLGLIGKKYGGEPGERFGPTLAAEHLEQDDRMSQWGWRRCGSGCWRQDYGAGSGEGERIGEGGSGRRILGSWCNWMEVSMIGWKGEVRGVV